MNKKLFITQTKILVSMVVIVLVSVVVQPKLTALFTVEEIYADKTENQSWPGLPKKSTVQFIFVENTLGEVVHMWIEFLDTEKDELTFYHILPDAVQSAEGMDRTAKYKYLVSVIEEYTGFRHDYHTIISEDEYRKWIKTSSGQVSLNVTSDELYEKLKDLYQNAESSWSLNEKLVYLEEYRRVKDVLFTNFE